MKDYWTILNNPKGSFMNKHNPIGTYHMDII